MFIDNIPYFKMNKKIIFFTRSQYVVLYRYVYYIIIYEYNENPLNKITHRVRKMEKTTELRCINPLQKYL